MPIARKTAVVRLTLPGDKTGPQGETVESRPLTREREYGVQLSIGDHVLPAGVFQSPRNDEQWREFVQRLRDCNARRDVNGDGGNRGAMYIRSFGAELYQKLADLSPKLREFLSDTGNARRLVIQTFRPELHLLPWSALYDENGKFVAAGDVSIVQAWEEFTLVPALFPENLTVRSDLGLDTQRKTITALQSLPEAWTVEQPGDPDILHIEAHGNAVTKEIGDVAAAAITAQFGKPKMALLWSCFSSAADSWGVSPALSLHRRDAAMVLSFQAELHNDDAKSIAEEFYADVFGAAASRDPESALVRIRSDKFKNEFPHAAWASMTVYLRRPLDLSSLTLNGPRLPAQKWSDAEADASWAPILKQVGELVPGGRLGLKAPIKPSEKLPRSLFQNWNGTVVRIDGDTQPAADNCIEELGLSPKDVRAVHPAERLVWLLKKIATYGQPLIVWTNSSPRHLQFLQTIKPSPALTFLLLYGIETTRTVPELVDEDENEEALKRSATEGAPSGQAGDEYWHAVYFASARLEKEEPALLAIGKIKGAAERLLVSGNFVSRFHQHPETSKALNDLERHQQQEEFYRKALSAAISDHSNPRDVGRAKLELGYLLKSRGESDAADLAYLAAAQSLERTPEKSALRDSRWHSALGRAFRDRAELLSEMDRPAEASALLVRALAIHSYHGRTLQVAYCRMADARIALATEKFSAGILRAMDAANDFEALKNWRGWAYAIGVLLDIFAEIGETARMLGVADLALKKIAASNLPDEQKKDQIYTFNLKIAEALFAAGELKAALEKMDKLSQQPPAKLKAEANRLRKFLTIEQ